MELVELTELVELLGQRIAAAIESFITVLMEALVALIEHVMEQVLQALGATWL